MVKDETGNRYGRLLVVGYAGKAPYGGAKWKCRCDCGVTTIKVGTVLRKGQAKSCGCLQRQLASDMAKQRTSPTFSHGRTGTKTYNIWAGMKYRCYQKNSKSYKNYGGRGIVVCDRWLASFENFLADMGECPDGMTIDRMDVNGPYDPSNCRWATLVEQANNKRSNSVYEMDGVKKSLADWARALNVKYTILQYKVKSMGFAAAARSVSAFISGNPISTKE